MQQEDDERQKRDKRRREKIAAMQKFVDDGLKSGIGTASKDELFEKARAAVRSNRP